MREWRLSALLGSVVLCYAQQSKHPLLGLKFPTNYLNGSIKQIDFGKSKGSLQSFLCQLLDSSLLEGRRSTSVCSFMKSQCFLSMRNWSEGEITLTIWRRLLRCLVTQSQPGWSRSPNLSSLTLALGLSRSEPFAAALLSLPLPFFLPPPAFHLSLSSAGAASPLPLHRAPSSLLPSQNAICSEINSKSNSDCFGERRCRKKHRRLISETPCV